VVEVVVSFTNGNESSDEVVAGTVFVIEWGFTEPVSERVYAEGRLETKSVTYGNKKKKKCTW
jgi:hypothetical protein